MNQASSMDGRTQLMIHAYQGSLHIVNLMVDAPDFKESDALAKDNQGLNALFYAVLGGHAAVVNILLHSTCQVLAHEKNFENVNCLYIACQNGHKEIVRQFLVMPEGHSLLDCRLKVARACSFPVNKATSKSSGCFSKPEGMSSQSS